MTDSSSVILSRSEESFRVRFQVERVRFVKMSHYQIFNGRRQMFNAGCIIVSLVLAVVFLIAPLTRAEKIRTAVPGLNLNYLSVFAAEERNFFRDEGLENETIVIGGPAGIAALVSGDVDYSGAGGSGLRRCVLGWRIRIA